MAQENTPNPPQDNQAAKAEAEKQEAKRRAEIERKKRHRMQSDEGSKRGL